MDTVRTMTLDEVDVLINWAAAEGWNPGIEDAAAFHAADPNGFIAAFVDNVLVAGISVVALGESDGFLGLYLCHPDYRGKGHGWRVWQAGMQYLQGRSIGLDGVVDQQANYRRSGFDLAYRNIRFEGTPKFDETLESESWKIQPLRSSDLPELLRIDEAVHGVNRQRFMSAWLGEPIDSRKTIVLRCEGTIEGFGTIRRCRNQYKVGPLLVCNGGRSDAIASSAKARTMISALVAEVDAQKIVLDVPEPNDAAMNVARQLGLVPAFETARMYCGRAPQIDVKAIYGVTTLELG